MCSLAAPSSPWQCVLTSSRCAVRSQQTPHNPHARGRPVAARFTPVSCMQHAATTAAACVWMAVQPRTRGDRWQSAGIRQRGRASTQQCTVARSKHSWPPRARKRPRHNSTASGRRLPLSTRRSIKCRRQQHPGTAACERRLHAQHGRAHVIRTAHNTHRDAARPAPDWGWVGNTTKIAV